LLAAATCEARSNHRNDTQLSKPGQALSNGSFQVQQGSNNRRQNLYQQSVTSWKLSKKPEALLPRGTVTENSEMS
jgi:hypothetical protein